LCDEKGVEIITFTAPKSIKHFQGIHEQKLENQLKIFKQTLASIFIENYDFFNESSMYYSTTKYMRDSAHPNKELSKEVMARIFGKSSLFNHPDFGKLISK
jgi:hypothetical protein